MMPRLDGKYTVYIETITKPKGEYLTDEYFTLDQPIAPAVMVGNEIIVEGTDVEEYTVEACICRYLDLPEPETPKKRFMDRFRGR